METAFLPHQIGPAPHSLGMCPCSIFKVKLNCSSVQSSSLFLEPVCMSQDTGWASAAPPSLPGACGQRPNHTAVCGSPFIPLSYTQEG